MKNKIITIQIGNYEKICSFDHVICRKLQRWNEVVSQSLGRLILLLSSPFSGRALSASNCSHQCFARRVGSADHSPATHHFKPLIVKARDWGYYCWAFFRWVFWFLLVLTRCCFCTVFHVFLQPCGHFSLWLLGLRRKWRPSQKKLCHTFVRQNFLVQALLIFCLNKLKNK